MDGDSRIPRRRLLGLLGAASLGPLAGCQFGASEATDAPATATATSPGSPTTRTSRPSQDGGTDSTAAVFDGDGTQAFVDALDALSNRGGGRLLVAADTYEFDPISGESSSGPHARLESLRDVTIDGRGATIAFTSPTMAGLHFVGGGGLTLRNLTVDYRPVPFSQGTITEVAPRERTLRLALDAGFPPLDHDMFGVPDDVTALIHRPDGEFVRGIRKQGRWDPAFASMDRVTGDEFVLRLTDDSSLTGLEAGRKLTVLARNNRSALSFYMVDGLTVDNVTVRAANGAAFGTGVCEDPVFRDCVVAPPPGSDRHIGGDADGIRIINARSSATVEGCRHEKLGDDSLVIQHTLGTVRALESDHTVRVANTHPFVLRESDTLDALSPTGVAKGKLPPVESMVERFRNSPGDRAKPETITFAAPIVDRLAVGDFLRVRETGSRGFTVRDNEFRDHRANLIRIAASDGVVEDNELVGCAINPIELETDTSGFFAPKGWVRDVTVRNNHIERAGLNYVTGSSPAGVRLHHRPAPDRSTVGRPNRRVTIRDNTIDRGASLGIEVRAAETVSIADNDLSGLAQLDFGTWSPYGIGVTDSADVTVTGNEVAGRASSLSGFGWYRESSDVTAANNELRIDGEARPARFVEWLPVTFTYDHTLSWAERNPDSRDTRPLAVFCYALTFVGDSSTTTIDVGGAEHDAAFEGGAYPTSTNFGRTGRWFGGPDARTTVYLPARVLSGTTRLAFGGVPMDPSITMRVAIDGTTRDAVTFGTREATTVDLGLRE